VVCPPGWPLLPDPPDRGGGGTVCVPQPPARAAHCFVFSARAQPCFQRTLWL